jgi:hypothetical protein
MTVKNFSHFGNIGDTLAALPALRQYYRLTSIKPILYLVKDHPAIYADGLTHPTKNSEGLEVSLNQQVCELLKPLVEAQDYIEEVRIISTHDYENHDIHINLSEIRNTYVGCPNFDLRRWYFYVFPDLACNLFEQYIFVDDSEKDLAKGKIIISRSERYQNESIDYSFLKKYEDDILFCGTMREYNNFTMNFNLEIKKLVIKDFYEYAQALKQCKFHLSNQTMAFQISQGLQIPRIVELCSYAPNVIPTGEKAYDFFAQTALEYYVRELMK